MSKTIINGIDVSECCCFENDRCLWTKRYYENCYVVPPCEAVKDCYFKQLKRLEQENEKLKASANEAKIEYENLLINRNDFAERAEKLKQENKELKEKIKDLESITGIFSVRLMEKYKHALEEIRNYCDEQNLKADYTACFITNMIDEILK